MKNNTSIKIPNKYKHMIDEVYKDSDGYWAYSKDGYRFISTDSHTAHGYTQAEFLDDIRSLAKCDCSECE